MNEKEEKNFLSQEVKEVFAEEQLKGNSESKMDSPFVLDDMNQQDVFEHLTTQGYSEKSASAHMQGIDFDEQVRLRNFDENSQFAQFREPESERIGNYFGSLDENLDRRKLGIENESSETQTREPSVFQSKEPVEALESTSKDIPDWQGSGETFTGGGKQLHVSDSELEKIELEYSSDRLLPTVTPNSEESRDEVNDSTDEDISNDLEYEVDDSADEGNDFDSKID